MIMQVLLPLLIRHECKRGIVRGGPAGVGRRKGMGYRGEYD
jgi:hypothetical protein